MKTSDLTGLALDWAVAVCVYGREAEGIKYGQSAHWRGVVTPQEKNIYWSPSTDWAQGGPIIKGEKICLEVGHAGVWIAYLMQNYDDRKEFMHSGPTPLITAMRCYVASKLGSEVEIPEDLK